VVPNKYPVVPGTGRHLVVIETPRHGDALENLASAHLETVVRSYRRAFGEVSSGGGVLYTALFRNQGVAGGASLAHSHTQVVGIDVVPDRVRRREARSHRHHRSTGRCLVCDMIAAEEADGVRLVTADPGFVAFVPWAAEVPCDTWIVPRRHQPDFRELRDDDVLGLAAVFRDVLTRVGAVSSAHNVTLESCSLQGGPRGGSRGSEVIQDPALHWFLRVRPRVTVAAGFEVATGISINPSLPERDASRLRGLRGA
jgi:UDPglucose--hexose-1-phosphate uridylyltransferase